MNRFLNITHKNHYVYYIFFCLTGLNQNRIHIRSPVPSFWITSFLCEQVGGQGRCCAGVPAERDHCLPPGATLSLHPVDNPEPHSLVPEPIPKLHSLDFQPNRQPHLACPQPTPHPHSLDPRPNPEALFSLSRSGGKDGVVLVFQPNGTIVYRLVRHAESVLAVTFSPDGKKLVIFVYSSILGDSRLCVSPS